MRSFSLCTCIIALLLLVGVFSSSGFSLLSFVAILGLVAVWLSTLWDVLSESRKEDVRNGIKDLLKRKEKK